VAAFKVFYSDLDRVSADIDIDYVGAIEKEHRPLRLGSATGNNMNAFAAASMRCRRPQGHRSRQRSLSCFDVRIPNGRSILRPGRRNDWDRAATCVEHTLHSPAHPRQGEQGMS
jgi:hypothetical protein